jgi:hypothetical protein
MGSQFDPQVVKAFSGQERRMHHTFEELSLATA